MAGIDDKTITSPHAVPAAPTPRTQAGHAPSIAAAPVASGFGPGTRIRQYELIRELGRGGMGQVFLARDTRLARRVALKFLATGSTGHTQRFLVEARATARCTHENIVVIHEVDEHAGLPYMVLEYLEGVTLRALSVRERVTPRRAVELVLPVVRALAVAHDHGIVHRDLKPDNIILTAGGTIKVLDFGIAKLLGRDEHVEAKHAAEVADLAATGQGVMMGTLPYMSPEQLSNVDVDHRTDVWAIGVMLYELASGRHPLAPFSVADLVPRIADVSRPIPELVGPEVPDALRDCVARCLAKRADERYATARELAEALDKALPGRAGRRLGAEDSPYPGLTSFQHADADRFFGRDHDVARVLARLRELPLVGIVGPSGVGKSSLVRAGVAPELEVGEPWRLLVVRPGRAPLASLASLVDGLDAAAIAARLVAEPGALGELLRARAARDGTRLLVFVDQFEELYTLCADPAQRRAFTTALCGVADDAAGPLRTVIAMRSDFLDRAGEDPRFLDDLTRGLVFLPPLARDGLRDALVRPLEQVGYTFESPRIVDGMVDELASTPAALPLLQFAASRLWDARDRTRKVLTEAGYAAMGGVAGALASHADQVVAVLAPTERALARTALQRLVTPERTRAIVDRDELRRLGAGIDAIVDRLVAARLLVAQTDAGGGNTIELVHESLIGGWPTLRRWLDEDHDDAAYVAQVRAAAKQWDDKGRPGGLLWSGDAAREARQFRARYRGELAAREQAFVDAVLALGERTARRRRIALIGGGSGLGLIAFASVIAVVLIQGARRDAEDHARTAQTATAQASDAAAAASAAEKRAQDELARVQDEQSRRAAAERDATEKGTQVKKSRAQLEAELAREQQATRLAEQESKKARDAEARAEASAAAEKASREQAEKLAAEQKAHADELEQRARQITSELRK